MKKTLNKKYRTMSPFNMTVKLSIKFQQTEYSNIEEQIDHVSIQIRDRRLQPWPTIKEISQGKH